MARYNLATAITTISSAATIGTPIQGAFVEFTGTTYTVTVPNPTLFPGATQTFYNAASGTVTLSSPSGTFTGIVGSAASTYVMGANSTVKIVSDGTNYFVTASTGAPVSATTLSASSSVTLSPASANVTISPTGTGNVVMNPATAGSINNMTVGQGGNPLAGTFTSLTATGTTTLQQITEVLTPISSYGTSQSSAFTNGDIFLLSGMSANFTFNWTSVPTTTNRTFTLTLILTQGGTPYIPSTLQINGAGVTINWAGGVTPSGRANKTDIVSLYIYYTGTFTAVGQLSSYG